MSSMWPRLKIECSPVGIKYVALSHTACKKRKRRVSRKILIGSHVRITNMFHSLFLFI